MRIATNLAGALFFAVASMLTSETVQADYCIKGFPEATNQQQCLMACTSFLQSFPKCDSFCGLCDAYGSPAQDTACGWGDGCSASCDCL